MQGTTSLERQLGFLLTFLEIVLVAYNLEGPFQDESRFVSIQYRASRPLSYCLIIGVH